MLGQPAVHARRERLAPARTARVLVRRAIGTSSPDDVDGDAAAHERGALVESEFIDRITGIDAEREVTAETVDVDGVLTINGAVGTFVDSERRTSDADTAVLLVLPLLCKQREESRGLDVQLLRQNVEIACVERAGVDCSLCSREFVHSVERNFPRLAGAVACHDDEFAVLTAVGSEEQHLGEERGGIMSL